MGFKTGDMPPVDPAAFETIPFRERIRILQTFWAEYGTGGPKIIHTIYIAKLVFFVVAGALITGLTPPGSQSASPGRVVGRADRLREGNAVDHSLRDHRLRLSLSRR